MPTSSSQFSPSCCYPLWEYPPEKKQHIDQPIIHGNVLSTAQPHIDIYTPQHPNGTAVIIMGGGGYHHIDLEREAIPTAKWLVAHGITAIVLFYRLPFHSDVPSVAPFQDAQRAMRIVRAKSPSLGIHPDRLGVLGFSAGGHLAAMTSTRFDHSFYDKKDDIDQLSSRPDFTALIYPVITMLPPYNHPDSTQLLCKDHAPASTYSAERYVTNNTPPTFIVHSNNDLLVDAHNSRMMFEALKAHNIPSYLHVFEKGGHGWGMPETGEVAIWPELLSKWAQDNHFFNDS